MPFLLALLFSVPIDPSVLTVPVLPDLKEVWIEHLHECENRDNVPWIVDSNGKKSYADLMFQMDTWLSYGAKYGATRENISSSTLQRIVARSMLDQGLWRRWYTCAKKVAAKYGAYPSLAEVIR